MKWREMLLSRPQWALQRPGEAITSLKKKKKKVKNEQNLLKISIYCSAECSRHLQPEIYKLPTRKKSREPQISQNSARCTGQDTF